MVKAELGIKRVCPSCGSRFYDLQKRPIECPKCSFSFEPETLYKQRRARQPEAAIVQPVAADADDEDAEDENEDEDAEGEEEEEGIQKIAAEAPLKVSATGEDEDDEEEEEAEENIEDAGMSVVDAEGEIEDVELDDEDEEDNTLLEEVEDDADDVSDIIDTDIEKDER